MISKEQVEHIAKLARIELGEKERERFTNDLSSILDYVDKLNKVDTSKTEPISQVTGLNDVVRDDTIIVNSQDTRNKILKEAPEEKNKYFKVPKILE